MTLALYGHPFSSYTWKALIALYANGTPFAFRVVGEGSPEHDAFVANAGPGGKFPVLRDGDTTVFEATSIIEYLHRNHPGPAPLIPADPDAAIRTRMWDRVFDLHIMDPMQEIVLDHIRNPGNPDPAVRERIEARLDRAYRWIEAWLETYPQAGQISLVECAAAPSLFYADWVHPVPADCPRLQAFRAHLLALPPVARCVEEARPYRHYFPLGAPDRD
ncbi:MAG: glutathione S-transferase family protein [Proteobacteria bacterium]|nr:glutathione S-transferase family protein [Pseudomonadota bacterium]